VSHSLAESLLRSADRHPDRPAQITRAGKRTYRELARRILRTAGGFRSAGVAPGERVALHLPNVPAFTEAYFGILAAGATVVPINVRLTAAEIGPMLERAQVKLLVTGNETTAAVRDAARRAGAFPLGAGELAAREGPNVPEIAGPDDTAVVFFTSGTTGQPKGVELSHASLGSNACWVSERSLERGPSRREALGPGHVALAVLPLSHSFGQTCMQNAPLISGAAVAYPDAPFDSDAALAQMARDRVTVVALVPTMASALAAAPDVAHHDLSSFRFALVGGAPIPPDLFERFESRLSAEIVEGYGLTETSPVCAFRTPAIPRRTGSVGKAAAGADIVALDEEGTVLSPGVTGELAVRGQPVMKGYLGDPEATNAVLQGGWLRTGDVGRVDADGYVFVVDRKADTIIRNGYNVYPAEVERALEDHPDIDEAAVLGVADARVGEEVWAFVVRRPGTETTANAVRGFLRDRLAAYKQPRGYTFTGSLPRGTKGQVLRAELGKAVRTPHGLDTARDRRLYSSTSASNGLIAQKAVPRNGNKQGGRA